MEVKIRLVEGGRMPTRMEGGAEGYACYARSCEPLVSGFTRCHLGFSLEMPDGMAALLIPRFSVCDLDNGSMASYGVVIVDGRCRGEVFVDVRHYPDGWQPSEGEEVAQMLAGRFPGDFLAVDGEG